MDSLKGMLEEGGKVNDVLSEVAKGGAQELAKAFDALGQFKNALLAVARLQEQMAKHRLDSELGILDKSEAIRDRVNNALGETPDATGQALKDLQKRMSTQLKGGVTQGGTPFAGDVLNPDALFARLETLESKREETREKLGLLPGQEMDTIMGGDATKMTEEMKKNSDILGKLNSEINGTTAALRELANDTRMLAAIEQKISDQQAKKDRSKRCSDDDDECFR